MRVWLFPLVFAATVVALPAAAQVWPGYPQVSQADIQRYRLEQQRLRSAEQAAFARQQRLNTRLTQLEVEAARQPEPYVALVEPLPSSRGTSTSSVAGSTARREAVSAGVRQIDAWLDRDPR
jgi:hypothetical protein